MVSMGMLGPFKFNRYEILLATDGQAAMNDDSLFLLEEVRCVLGNQTIPNETGWTLEIERGCRLAVLGRSGSGKSGRTGAA